jgi:hypothetical protein
VGWRRDRTVAHWALERGHSCPRGTALVSPAPTGHLLGTTSRRGGRDFCFSTKAALCVAGTTVTAHPAGGRTRSLGPRRDSRDNPCRRQGDQVVAPGSTACRVLVKDRTSSAWCPGPTAPAAQLHGGCCTKGSAVRGRSILRGAVRPRRRTVGSPENAPSRAALVRRSSGRAASRPGSTVASGGSSR